MTGGNMENLMKAQESAKLVDKNLTPLWILWTYLGAYELEGMEYKGGH